MKTLTVTSQPGYYKCAVNDSISEPSTSRAPYVPANLPTRGNACVGPRGIRLNESKADMLHAYSPICKGNSRKSLERLNQMEMLIEPGFPSPLFGSYQAIGLDDGVCFDRHGRYGPYGFGSESSSAASLEIQSRPDEVDWNKLSWGSLQRQCVLENWDEAVLTGASNTSKSLHHRTAVLIRTWDSYDYEENDLQAIRALVS